MSPEREKRMVPVQEIKVPSPYDVWRLRLEKVRSTGQLLRTAKGILRTWPPFMEQAGTASLFHIPWITVGNFMIRFDYLGYNNESLRIDRVTDFKTSNGESVEIPYKGWDSEEGFEDLTYIQTVEMGGEELRDEVTGQTFYIGEPLDIPRFGQNALPKAKEILGDILDNVTDEFQRKEKDKMQVSFGAPIPLDPNYLTKRSGYFDMGFNLNGAFNGVITLAQQFHPDGSKIWSISLTLKDLVKRDFDAFEVSMLYDGKNYKASETDIDNVALRKGGKSPVHFFDFVDGKGKELILNSSVDIFSKVGFLVERKNKRKSKK